MHDLDERGRYEELQRAQRAKELLENPMLNSAFDDIEKEVLAAFEHTHDTEQILKLHRMFVWGRKVRNVLRQHIETGKLAAFQLEEKRKFKLWSN